MKKQCIGKREDVMGYKNKEENYEKSKKNRERMIEKQNEVAWRNRVHRKTKRK